MSVSRKIAMVTGAARGIGFAIAEELARLPMTLCLIDRDGAGLARAAAHVRDLGAEAFTYEGDISDWDVPPRWAQDAEARFGRIDVLVNCAGVFEYGVAFETITETQFDRMLGVNLKGVFRMTQAVVPVMERQGSGAIVSLASAAGLVGSGMRASHYGASKGAVVALTRSLARELGPKGIRVNAVSPGAVDTDMTRGFGAKERSLYATTNPLGRMAHPREIASVVRFLADDASSYVNGQTLSVCGGAVQH